MCGCTQRSSHAVHLLQAGTSPFITGMAIAGGMGVFDSAWKGALLGPTVVALVMALHSMALSFSAEKETKSSLAD